ncbi:hypothetical protein CBL_10005 [Carabus blaptoides fortunei]
MVPAPPLNSTTAKSNGAQQLERLFGSGSPPSIQRLRDPRSIPVPKEPENEAPFLKMSSSSSSSSSSSLESLEELGMIIDLIHDEKKYQVHANPFETYDEAEFKLRFRFSKQTVQNFLQLIDTKLEPIQNKRELLVSKMNQLLLALRFYATGSFQLAQGDLMHVHQSTVSRIVCRVTNAIASLCPEYIKMPTTRRDCLAVQISDSDTKIIACNARYPGSVHDSAIWQMSNIKQHLRRQYENGDVLSHLIGDSGYPLEPWLFTPFAVVQEETPEAKFNKNLSTM